jgi:hypothetical protein
MKRTLILVALGAYVMALPANTIKRRLAQARGDDGGDIPDDGGDVPDDGGDDGLDVELCTCELSGAVGAGLGEATQGVSRAHAAAAIRESSLNEESSPDTLYHTACETESCNCAVFASNANKQAESSRVYTLSGSIDAVETIEYEASGNTREESKGYSIKESACITLFDDNDSGDVPDVPDVDDCVCPEPEEPEEPEDDNGAILG